MNGKDQHKRHRGQAYIDYCVEALRLQGARITKPRLAVLEALAASDQSLSPGALLEWIRDNRGITDIDLATVYRNLEALLALGLVHRVGPTGEFVACAHPACDVDMHLVIHCLSCDSTREIDAPGELLDAVKKHILKSTRFHPDEHFFQVNGRCADCYKA